jgi:translation initiation factor IF-3
VRILPKKSFKKSQQKSYRVNEEIQAPEVRVIDEEGKNLGIFPISQALELAAEKGLDLVEINPKAVPPITKILDYGKFLYQKEKELKKQKAKQKRIETKGIRLSLYISPHDTQTRLEQAKNFLKEDNKVEVEILLKGREHQFIGKAKEILNNFIKSLDAEIPTEIDQPLEVKKNRVSVVLRRK